MALTTEPPTYWSDRIERIQRIKALADRRLQQPEEYRFVGIAAGDLRVGDSLIWGDRVFEVEDMVLRLRSAESDVEAWLSVRSSEMTGDLSLLPQEEVLVLLPRPPAAEQKDRP